MLEVTAINRINQGKNTSKKNWGSSKSISNYFLEAKDDYYSKEGEYSSWQGKGAKSLGIENQSVNSKTFQELLEGKHNNQVLKKSSNRLALDFTFSAPKSISIQSLIGQDEKLIQAHENAVSKALETAENMAKARITNNKITTEINTSNLIIAKFRHETSRRKDPQLHTHALIMNMTQKENGEWAALVNDTLYKNKKLISAIYKSELAKSCIEMGYDIRQNKKNDTFELSHFSQEQLDQFSKRSQEIEHSLKEQGLTREDTNSKQRSKIALETRHSKDRNLDRKELFKEWEKQAKEAGINLHEIRKERTINKTKVKENKYKAENLINKSKAADEALKFAINSLSERQTVLESNILKHAALDHGFGQITLDDVDEAIQRALKKEGSLLKSEPIYTDGETKNMKGQNIYKTKSEWQKYYKENNLDQKSLDTKLYSDKWAFVAKEGLNIEKEILAIEKLNRGTVENKIKPELINNIISQYTLSQEQEKAVRNIVQSTDRFIASHGYAGVGKSYMTKVAKEIIEKNNGNVIALAPYGNQVKALQNEGMKAQTLASFLVAKDKKIDKNTVVFVDEAGVIPSKQMKKTMEIVKELGGRIVFLGDTAQTKAVEAGKPFDQLIKNGMQTSYVSTIQRQKDKELLHAVQLSALGKTKDSVEALKKQIITEKDHFKRHQILVNKYVALSQKDREKTLIVTGTNESRRDINQKVREALQIVGKGEKVTMLNRYDSTKEERKYARYYEKDMVIQPEQDYKQYGLKRGELYTIIDTGTIKKNQLTVKDKDGNQIIFNPRIINKLSLYQPEKNEIAIGDRIRITRNDKDLDVANGDQFFIKKITQDKIVLRGIKEEQQDVILNKNKPLYLSYAYATTVHSSQGMTCDRSFVNIDTKSNTTTNEVYYVAISRAKYETQIFTDDIDKLPKAISQKSMKTSALDFNWEKEINNNIKQEKHKTNSLEMGM